MKIRISRMNKPSGSHSWFPVFDSEQIIQFAEILVYFEDDFRNEVIVKYILTINV